MNGAERVQESKKSSFMHMLRRAERKSREHAKSAKIVAGGIPIQSKMAYRRAEILRDGNPGEKLRALALFWESSFYSQTAVMLARNPKD